MSTPWLQYIMASMHLKAVDVIKKPPSERTKGEVELIAPWLRKQTHLLTGLEKESLEQIVKNCDYMKTDKDEILIRQGDKGDCLFIILVGHVSVYVDAGVTNDPSRNQRSRKRDPSNISPEKEEAPSDGRSSTHQSIKSVKKNVNNERLDRSKYGKMVVKFDEGKCFGEVALVSEDSRRNATIITDSPTDLLVIRKELYDSTLKEHQEKEFEEKRKFARKHPLFKNWDKRLHRILEMSLVKEVYGFGAQIVKQGEPFNGLLFFLKGRARLLVEPSRHNQQYEDHFPFAVKNDIYAIEFNRPQKKRPEHPEEILRWEHIEIRRTEGYAAAEKRRFHREIPLCIVEEGEILGDIECVCGLGTHMVSAVCMSPIEVFTLSLKNLERLTKRVPKTMETLRMGVQTKLKKRLQSQQGSEVFMYQHLNFKLTDEIPLSPRKSPDYGVGMISKKLPEKDVLFQHLMTAFQENKAAAVEPHVEGSIFLRERMREKARLRNVVKENKRSSEGQRKYRKARLKRPPSAKPRSIKHLRIALKKQETSAEQSEREYLAREYRSLENQVMEEFYLNSLASLDEKGDQAQGIQVLCNRLQKAGINLSALPKLILGDDNEKLMEEQIQNAEQQIGLPGGNLMRQKTFVTELNLSEPDLARKLEREPTVDSVKFRETKSAEPPNILSPPEVEIQESADFATKSDTAEPPNILSQPEVEIQESADLDTKSDTDEIDDQQDSEAPVLRPHIPTQPRTPTPPPTTPPLNAATEAIIAKEAVNLEPTPRFLTTSESGNMSTDEEDSPLMTSQNYKQLQHVRSLISNRVELASEDPKYRNWETSDTSLQYLEQRVKNFKINREPTFVRLPALKRYEAGDEKDQPKPGGRVIIQRKRCTADDTEKHVTNHMHIRRHVVSKVPDYSKLRHHKMLSHYVLDDIRAKWLQDQKGQRNKNSYHKMVTGGQSQGQSQMSYDKDTVRSYGSPVKPLPSIANSR